MIVERIKKLVEGGRKLTIKLIGEVMAEEAEVIKINQDDNCDSLTSSPSLPAEKYFFMIHGIVIDIRS